MVTVEEFSRLVSGVYAAAVTPQHWAVALADISRILDASGCGTPDGRRLQPIGDDYHRPFGGEQRLHRVLPHDRLCARMPSKRAQSV